jgi:hypothetical protein
MSFLRSKGLGLVVLIVGIIGVVRSYYPESSTWSTRPSDGSKNGDSVTGDPSILIYTISIPGLVLGVALIIAGIFLLVKRSRADA